MNIKSISDYVYWFTFIIIAILITLPAIAQSDSNAQKSAPTAERDGQHDFDPFFGSWKAHLKRRLHPLTGSNEWTEYDATIVYKKIWDGRANYSELETTSGSPHIEGVTLRTYNPQTHQWRLYWASSKDGILAPAQVGEFRNGRGEFFAEDTINGKTILVRYVWSNIENGAPHFEQSFSDDGGATWEVNWISDQTRIPDDSVKPVPPPADADASNSSANSNEQMPEPAMRDGQHDFDGLVGDWKYHLRRRQNPLTGSNTWVDWSGTGDCHKIWGGRANMDTFEADAPTGHIEGLTLRLYNPQTHEWRLYWANSKTGIIDPPQIGKFKNGHGEFYTQDTINNKTIFIKFDWTGLTSASPHFEQSFSDDGGKSWESNWITDQTRVNN